MRHRFSTVIPLLLAATTTTIVGADTATLPLVYAPGRAIATLEHPGICESSGLAPGRINPRTFWTHNDSGDGPRLFAFDMAGRSRGVITVAGAKARDWEDMASFTHDGRGVLLIGDIGDNPGKRKRYTLYAVDEPKLPDGRAAETKIKPTHTITFRYEDGPHNCESLAVDPADRTIYLAIKAVGDRCNVYTLPWPSADTPPDTVHVARRLATLTLPIATAMDISPDGRRAVVLSYGDAYEYVRQPDETWRQAFARPARRIKMPRRVQGESICYGPDGRTLYLTSECRKRDSSNPSPLLEVPVKK